MDENRRAEQLARAVAGDSESLQKLIVYYHSSWRQVIVANADPDLTHRIDPDDILQLAYVTVFEALPQAQFDGPAGFYKWGEAIAISRLRDAERALRRRKRDVGREVRDAPRVAGSCPGLIDRVAHADPSPSRQLARDEAVAVVLSSLARLKPDYREVIRLRFLEGQEVADIARKLGRSEGAIHVLCHRSLKALRELLHPVSRFHSRAD